MKNLQIHYVTGKGIPTKEVLVRIASLNMLLPENYWDGRTNIHHNFETFDKENKIYDFMLEQLQASQDNDIFPICFLTNDKDIGHGSVEWFVGVWDWNNFATVLKNIDKLDTDGENDTFIRNNLDFIIDKKDELEFKLPKQETIDNTIKSLFEKNITPSLENNFDIPDAYNRIRKYIVEILIWEYYYNLKDLMGINNKELMNTYSQQIKDAIRKIQIPDYFKSKSIIERLCDMVELEIPRAITYYRNEDMVDADQNYVACVDEASGESHTGVAIIENGNIVDTFEEHVTQRDIDYFEYKMSQVYGNTIQKVRYQIIIQQLKMIQLVETVVDKDGLTNMYDFHKKLPNYGDLIIWEHCQMLGKSELIIFDKTVEWLDGDEWCLVRKGNRISKQLAENTK